MGGGKGVRLSIILLLEGEVRCCVKRAGRSRDRGRRYVLARAPAGVRASAVLPGLSTGSQKRSSAPASCNAS